MNFGEKIKYLRNEKGWTQEYVAKKLNISTPALSRYEAGTYEPKDLSIVSEFAKLYDVTTDYLLGISDERKPLPADSDFRIGLSRTEEGSLSEDEKQQIRDFAKYVISKRGGK